MLQQQPGGVLRQRIRKQVGPFHDQYGVSVQILVPAYPEKLGLVPQPVKIKMAGPQPSAPVFMHQGKRGAGGGIRAPQPLHNPLSQMRFPRPQLSYHAQHLSRH